MLSGTPKLFGVQPVPLQHSPAVLCFRLAKAGFEIPDASALRQFSSIFLHPCIEPTHPQNSKLVAKTQYAAFRNTGVKG